MVSKASEDFPEPGKAGEHHKLVARNLDVDVLEIVLARAADRDNAAVETADFCGA